MKRLFNNLTFLLSSFFVFAVLLFPVVSSAQTVENDIEHIKDQKLGRAIVIRNRRSAPLQAHKRALRGERLPGTAEAPHDPVIIADRFLKEHGDSLGVEQAYRQLMPQHAEQDDLGMTHVRYQQWYRGIPVYGTEVIVHIDRNHEVSSVNGKMVPGIAINTRARIQRALAQALARVQFNRDYRNVRRPTIQSSRLLVFNKGIIENTADTSVALVWEVQFTSQNPMVDQYYYIDAHSGRLVYKLSGIRGADYSINRSICDCSAWSTFGNRCSCGRTWPWYYPDYRFGRQEYHEPCGVHPVKTDYPYDTDNLFDLIGQAHEYFWVKFGRDGGNTKGGLGDGSGAPLTLSRGFVYLEGQGWDCDTKRAAFEKYQIGFCAGNVVPDIVGHEYGHAITYYRWDISGNLNSMVYQNESGALQENYSDIAGEALELYVTGDNDWLIGADTPRGVIRNMADPRDVDSPSQANPRPDRYYHEEFYCGEEDHGGVHYNANIINKASYLIAEGGDFNGCTVEGIGIEKLEQIFYRAATVYYTTTENFNQAYHSILNACNDLYDQADCAQVEIALQAVEIDQPGACSGVPAEPATCAGQGEVVLHSESFDDMSAFSETVTPIRLRTTYWSLSNARGIFLPFRGDEPVLSGADGTFFVGRLLGQVGSLVIDPIDIVGYGNITVKVKLAAGIDAVEDDGWDFRNGFAGSEYFDVFVNGNQIRNFAGGNPLGERKLRREVSALTDVASGEVLPNSFEEFVFEVPDVLLEGAEELVIEFRARTLSGYVGIDSLEVVGSVVQ